VWQTDTQPASYPASHVAVAYTRYAYLRRAVKEHITNLCLLNLCADNAGYIPAAAVSVPTSPPAVSSFSSFYPSPVVLSSQMLKNTPLIAPGLQCVVHSLPVAWLLHCFHAGVRQNARCVCCEV